MHPTLASEYTQSGHARAAKHTAFHHVHNTGFKNRWPHFIAAKLSTLQAISSTWVLSVQQRPLELSSPRHGQSPLQAKADSGTFACNSRQWDLCMQQQAVGPLRATAGSGTFACNSRQWDLYVQQLTVGLLQQQNVKSDLLCGHAGTLVP